jgi:tetratricopeptide (TPR) repeat protein
VRRRAPRRKWRRPRSLLLAGGWHWHGCRTAHGRGTSSRQEESSAARQQRAGAAGAAQPVMSAFGNFAPPEVARSEALSEQARLAFEAGDLVRATEHYRRAVAAAPAHKVYPYALGQCLATAGDTEGAAAAFRQSLSIDPDWSAPYRALADLGVAVPDQPHAAGAGAGAGGSGGGAASNGELSVATSQKAALLAKYFGSKQPIVATNAASNGSTGGGDSEASPAAQQRAEGNRLFRTQQFAKAAERYTEALRLAGAASEGGVVGELVVACHANRAACRLALAEASEMPRALVARCGAGEEEPSSIGFCVAGFGEQVAKLDCFTAVSGSLTLATPPPLR